MRKLILLAMIVALLAMVVALLSGCGGKEAMPIFANIVGESGEVTKTVSTYTHDASVAKENYVHNTLQNRDIQYRKAHEQSGLKIEFEMVAIGGTQAYLPKVITFRETPDFNQPLPTEPSQHPVWSTAQNVSIALAKYGLYGYLGGELFDFLGTAWASAGSVYNGDVIGSFNEAGGDTNFSTDYLLIHSDWRPVDDHSTIIPGVMP